MSKRTQLSRAIKNLEKKLYHEQSDVNSHENYLKSWSKKNMTLVLLAVVTPAFLIGYKSARNRTKLIKIFKGLGNTALFAGASMLKSQKIWHSISHSLKNK